LRPRAASLTTSWAEPFRASTCAPEPRTIAFLPSFSFLAWADESLSVSRTVQASLQLTHSFRPDARMVFRLWFGTEVCDTVGAVLSSGGGGGGGVVDGPGVVVDGDEVAGGAGGAVGGGGGAGGAGGGGTLKSACGEVSFGPDVDAA